MLRHQLSLPVEAFNASHFCFDKRPVSSDKKERERSFQNSLCSVFFVAAVVRMKNNHHCWWSDFVSGRLDPWVPSILIPNSVVYDGYIYLAVVVAQLVERSLPASDICGSNSDIGKRISTNCTIEKMKIKKKRPGMARLFYSHVNSTRFTGTQNILTCISCYSNFKIILFFVKISNQFLIWLDGCSNY